MTKMFAEPVTEVLAANYFEIIRNPMDLSTMRNKAKRGQYKALQSLRQDLELMCLNAMVFNKVSRESSKKSFIVDGNLSDNIPYVCVGR